MIRWTTNQPSWLERMRSFFLPVFYLREHFPVDQVCRQAGQVAAIHKSAVVYQNPQYGAIIVWDLDMRPGRPYPPSLPESEEMPLPSYWPNPVDN